ncbi:GNAT family N-acetyltransferase [Clostridium sp.]
MLIRKLIEVDAKQFWALRLRGLREEPQAFGVSYEEELNTPIDKLISRFSSEIIFPLEENFIMGAFNENDDMVGVVGFRRGTRIKLKHKSNIWGMYVVPEFRQMGTGKLLVAELLNSAKTLEGLEQINLEVVSSNFSARRLYDSFGFKTYGVEKNSLKIGEEYFNDELMMLFIGK